LVCANKQQSNLHVAVELGQRLLKRNQALLEEQVGLRRSVAEKEHRVKELEAALMRAREKMQENESQKTIERVNQEKLVAERQRDINADRILDLDRTIENLKRVMENRFLFGFLKVVLTTRWRLIRETRK
jgi:predicted  nucleic acid-binding Zn-ribbon protein